MRCGIPATVVTGNHNKLVHTLSSTQIKPIAQMGKVVARVLQKSWEECETGEDG